MKHFRLMPNLGYQIKKERITVRIDRDILEWLKSQGPGYQTRMNAILRQYMQAKTHSNEQHPD